MILRSVANNSFERLGKMATDIRVPEGVGTVFGGDTELCKVQLCDETKDGNITENIIFYKRNLGSPSISKVI